MILNNGEVLHRAHYNKTLKINERINLHIALTPKDVEPYRHEKLGDFKALEKRLSAYDERSKGTILESLKFLIPSQ